MAKTRRSSGGTVHSHGVSSRGAKRRKPASTHTVGGMVFSKGPAHSKAQWRWMYATHQKFAHKWSEAIELSRGPKTGYRSLPRRKGARKATGSRLRG